MDTDDLSSETFIAVIETAEKSHHDLALQFGVLASGCESDNEFLDQSESIINEWLSDWEIDEITTEIFFDDPPTRKEFKKILDKILSNIEGVRKIPTEKRIFNIG